MGDIEMTVGLVDKIKDKTYWEPTFNKLMDKDTISDDERFTLTSTYAFGTNEISNRICNGKYEWSIPRKVAIKKSGTNKHRIVYIYSIVDRLVLGMLYNVLSNHFSDLVSSSCYSYKKGCSTGTAISAIRNNISNRHNYGVKVDIHAYFNNINSFRIKQMLEELFSIDEYNGIKQTFEKLLFDDRCMYKNSIIHEYKGVIPGTPIASFFANYCLRECDYYFDSKDCIYARYSDDIIIINSSKEELDKSIAKIEEYLALYGLELNPEKYKYFYPGDDITFLGLKLHRDGTVDMSDHAKEKIKKQIHRWCKKGRKDIEMNGAEFMKVASTINRRLNYKNFKCFIAHDGTFGWCHYMFRYITTDKSLKELDEYTKNTLRAMKTGKHNKANYRALSEEEFKAMGWVSLTQLFHLFKRDFEYYCEVIDLF